MSMSFIASKLLPAFGATLSLSQVTDQVILTPDPMLGVLGIEVISKPMFFLAMLGASVSVLFMRGPVVDGLDVASGATKSGRALSLLLKMTGLAGAVLMYALLSASILTILLDYLTDGPTIHSTPGWNGSAFVLGFFIRFLLPKMQSGLERAIDVTVNAYEGALNRIGGGGP